MRRSLESGLKSGRGGEEVRRKSIETGASGGLVEEGLTKRQRKRKRRKESASVLR